MKPSLRFPGFVDAWDRVNVSSVVDSIKSGVSVNSNDSPANKGAFGVLKTSCVYGGVFFPEENKEILANEVNRAKLNPKEDAILVSRMNTPDLVGQSGYVNHDYKNLFVPDRLWQVYIKSNHSVKFVSYIVSGAEFMSRVKSISSGTSNSMKNISQAEFLGLPIVLPSKKEQEKIAAFLMAVDERIELASRKVEKLETYKRGLTQKIFTRTLRFKHDDGSDFPEWKNKKLGEIVERINRKNDVGSKNILTISAQHGLVSQDKYFSKVVASENLNSYYLMNRGDFAYNKSYSKGYPMGAVKRLYGNEGIVSPLYICFRAKSTIVGEYLDQYFFSGLHNSEIYKIAQEGVRNHGLLNVSVVDFFSINIIIPACNEEQQKIATFLSQIDEKITLETKKLEGLKKFKRSLLQKMFV